MSTAPNSQLGLKQYSKEVPPGFRPGAYPVAEWLELLSVWRILTVFAGDNSKIGAAMFARLELGALDLARRLTVPRWNATVGRDENIVVLAAVQLGAQEAVYDFAGAVLLSPYKVSGPGSLVRTLVAEYQIADQDKSWIALAAFFSLQGGSDFLEYDHQFWSR